VRSLSHDRQPGVRPQRRYQRAIPYARRARRRYQELKSLSKASRPTSLDEEILQDFRDFVTATQLNRGPTDLNALVTETIEEVFQAIQGGTRGRPRLHASRMSLDGKS